MSAERPKKTGSFGGHLEELVKHFPARQSVRHKPELDRQRLKEKIDIHALLFQMAWQVERDKRGS